MTSSFQKGDKQHTMDEWETVKKKDKKLTSVLISLMKYLSGLITLPSVTTDSSHQENYMW